MENTLSTILMIAFLLIGAVGGVVLTPGEDCPKVEDCPVAETVYQNITVDKLVEIPAPNQLDRAVEVFMKAVDDEEDEDGSDIEILDDMGYNFDEVSVNEIYEDYSIVVSDDGDLTTVEFDIELKFKDSHDSEKEDYRVIVTFEDDENTLVEVA